MAGILACGAYIPWRRLQRQAIYAANSWFAPGLKALAKGERAIANWDEDPITMAVEAARDCLGDRSRETIRGLIMASTSFPYADLQNSGIVKEALGLADEVASLDVGGSQKAGTGALLQGLHAAAAGAGPVLVLAGEKRKARPASEDELLNGDAAAAFVLTESDGLARFIGSHSTTREFIDHFRPDGRAFDYGWEARWIREEGIEKLAGAAIDAAFARHGLSARDVARFVVGVPIRGVGAAIARRAGIAPQAVVADLSDTLGHAGCAQPLIMLAHALETAQAGEIVMVLGIGQGVDILFFQATGATGDAVGRRGVRGGLSHSVRDENYMRYLALSGQVQLELGKRAEFEQKPQLSALYRNRRAVLGLIGGRCTRTGTVQFPRTEIGVDPRDHAVGTQEDYPLADRPARVLTFTADSLTYTPDPPNYYGMIDFEGGGRMLAEFTDTWPGAISVGAPVRMMFRIKAVDERTGFTKYFWKAVPAAGS